MVSGVNAVSVFHQRRWLLKVMNSIITVSRAAFRWAQASKLMAREHMNQLRLIQFTFRVRKALMSSERQFVVLPLSSLSVVFLSCLSLCTPLSHFLYRIAKKHINHWSVQLIFPPTCQEKEREHHRPYPGSVYLCYYYRINGEASLSFMSSQKSLYSAKRDREWDVCQFASERNGSSRKAPHSLLHPVWDTCTDMWLILLPGGYSPSALTIISE